MSLLRLLGNNGFISYNKDIARTIGVNEAIVLGELCSIADLYKYAEFYFSQEKIENDTGLSVKAIRSAINTLASYGFVTVTKKGQPCKNWYFLNEDVIVNYLKQFGNDSQVDENCVTRCDEMEQLDVPNLPNKKGRNSTSSKVKRAQLLNNNTLVTIQSNNTNSISKADKRKTEVIKKKREEFLNALSESDVQIYSECADAFIDFQKQVNPAISQDKNKPKWTYDFALYSQKNGIEPSQMLKLLKFVLADINISQYIFKPDNFFKRYGEFSQRLHCSNNKSSQSKTLYQKPEQYTDEQYRADSDDLSVVGY